ncbi:MAG: SRPBCC family protein [Acidobacteriota bacterium]
MKKNLHKLERILSTVAGGALAAYGFTPKVEQQRFTLPSIITTITGVGLTTYGIFFQKRRTVTTQNLLLGLVGAGLVVRGLTGVLPIPFLRGRREGSEVEHVAGQRKGKKVERTILVNAPVDKVYKLWSNFENFPQWMENVESVHYLGTDRTHWRVKSRTGIPFEYEARIKTNIANEVISWESVSGELPNAGSVRFENVNGATRLDVTIEVNPPGGVIGEKLADLLRDPERQLEEDLLNFKRIAEGAAARTKTA